VPFATERLKPARDDFRSQVLSVEEEKALILAAQPYQRAQIIAALDAGMHKKEIFGQKWSDADLKNNLITMTASKKGRVGRVVPLTKRFADVLKDLPKDSEYVFTFKGERILTDTKKGWYRILRDAKIQPIRFHDLRATFGTRLEDELDIAPAISMALMGHNIRSVGAHGRYIRTRLARMREAIAKLDEWIERNGLDLETILKARRPGLRLVG
jgi:integrase